MTGPAPKNFTEEAKAYDIKCHSILNSLKITALSSIITIISSTPNFANEIVELKDGRTVLLRTDGTYEIVQMDPAAKVEDYQLIDFLDLQLDIGQMTSQKIQVRADIQVTVGIVMLSPPRSFLDMNPIMGEIDDLSRSERAYLLQNCSTGCTVTVRGQISQILFEPGVKIHSITP